MFGCRECDDQVGMEEMAESAVDFVDLCDRMLVGLKMDVRW